MYIYILRSIFIYTCIYMYICIHILFVYNQNSIFIEGLNTLFATILIRMHKSLICIHVCIHVYVDMDINT
jgi:hypothetical protein